MKKIYQNTEKKEYVMPEVKIQGIATNGKILAFHSQGGAAKQGTNLFQDEFDDEESDANKLGNNIE